MKKLSKLVLVLFSVIILIFGVVINLLVIGWLDYNTAFSLIEKILTTSPQNKVILGITEICMLFAIICIFADSGSKVNNLADSWKNLKSAGGEASLNANASWLDGTKEKLENDIGEINLKATATVGNIKWEAGQTNQQVVDKNGKSHTIYKELGGLFKNGKWKPIQKYAAGGVPNRGEMFVAREKGAELVGRIGGGTGVMNNDQIVASVSAGVYKAVVAAMANAPTSQTNVTLQGDVAKLFRVVRSEGLDYQRRTGNPVFP